jgi:hypothetical protein
MNVFARVAAAVLAVGLAFSPLRSEAAGPVTKLPGASRYYPLLGHWRGTGQLSQAGQRPVRLALRISCHKAASGSAVRCDLVGRSAKMTYTESDLFGVDAATGTGHWYAVTNQGEASDLVTEWTDGKTMRAHRAWSQDNKKMAEDVTFLLPHRSSFEFRSMVTAYGKEVGVFSGRLVR